MTRMKMIMLSLLAVFAVSAVASASASAASLEWEVCEELAGEGKEPPLKFDTHSCNSEAKPLAQRKWEWKLLATGEERKVVSLGGAFKLTGGTVEIKCLHIFDESNIKGGKPGTDIALRIHFLECSTSKAGCLVKSAGLPAKAGLIEVNNIATKLITEPGPLEADLFEGTLTEVEPGVFEKVFVTLEFGTAEVADNKLSPACSGVPPKTKVTGNVAAETVGGKLVFPNPPLTSSTIKAFGLSVKLIGEDEQAVVQSFTEKVSEGWAVRAS
jgi:hypothetical protein